MGKRRFFRPRTACQSRGEAFSLRSTAFLRRRLLSFLCCLGAAGLISTLILSGQSRSQYVSGCRQEDLAEMFETTAAQPAADENTVKTVYLTFDDGPCENTEKLLDILKEYDARATFFVIAAENNEEYLPVLKRATEEGHCIGLHTCSHSYREIYASSSAYWQDIDSLKEKLAPVCGDQVFTLLRFPGGSTNTVSHKYGGSGLMKELIREAQEKGYTVVDWNVTAEDAVGGNPSANTIASRVIRGCKDKTAAVVLMHDTNATGHTLAALPTILQWLKENNYTFDTADHLPASLTVQAS